MLARYSPSSFSERSRRNRTASSLTQSDKVFPSSISAFRYSLASSRSRSTFIRYRLPFEPSLASSVLISSSPCRASSPLSAGFFTDRIQVEFCPADPPVVRDVDPRRVLPAAEGVRSGRWRRAVQRAILRFSLLMSSNRKPRVSGTRHDAREALIFKASRGDERLTADQIPPFPRLPTRERRSS